MRKTISINSKYILLFCCLWICSIASAQLKKFPEIFPALPFDLNMAAEQGNMKCVIWKGIYKMSDGDESGYIWSAPVEESFQYQRYVFPDGSLDLISTYIPTGDKVWTMEVFYKQGHLSAIEKLAFDSTQEGHLDFAYNYFYKKDGSPFQRVKLFGPPNRGIRLLDEFVFDTLNRVVRQKTTAVGRSPDMDSLVGLKDKENFLTLVEYETLTLARRVYKNLYVIQSDSKIFYNDEGKPGIEEIRNAEGKILLTINYEYKKGRLSKKTHWVNKEVAAPIKPKVDEGKKKKKKKKKKKQEPETIEVDVLLEDPKPEIYKLEFFVYNEEGLLGMHIIEENGIQTVYEYTFFIE